MDKRNTWWQAHRPTTRRLAQLYCALLYNANLKGFLEGKIYTGNVKAACVPGLNCYSCPGAVAACPLGALQNAAASAGTHAGTYILGILMLFGVMLGRTICGWLCPMGLIQELLHKIPTPKIRKSRVTRVLSWLKYAVLAVFVMALPLWYGVRHGLPLPAFCKYICPAGTLEGAAGLLVNEKNADLFSMLGILFTRKWVILLVIGLACVFCYRSFCRFLCPLGAIYGFFSRFALIGVRVDPKACIHCGACVKNCRMDVRHVGDHECIHCGECMNGCPTGAIAVKAGRVILKASDRSCGLTGKTVSAREQKKRRRIGAAVWAVLLMVLAGALVYFNLIAPSAQESPLQVVQSGRTDTEEQETVSEVVAPEEVLTVGSAVGEQMADFTVETVGGGNFHLLEQRGHVTMINLWATYCGPCVQELPYFCQLVQEHPEVAVLAVHSSMVTEDDIPGYLAGKNWEGLTFAVDTADEQVFRTVGGDNVLPRTIVLNSRGVVIYNQAGSVTYEKLEALLQEAQN